MVLEEVLADKDVDLGTLLIVITTNPDFLHIESRLHLLLDEAPNQVTNLFVLSLAHLRQRAVLQREQFLALLCRHEMQSKLLQTSFIINRVCHLPEVLERLVLLLLVWFARISSVIVLPTGRSRRSLQTLSRSVCSRCCYWLSANRLAVVIHSFVVVSCSCSSSCLSSLHS